MDHDLSARTRNSKQNNEHSEHFTRIQHTVNRISISSNAATHIFARFGFEVHQGSPVGIPGYERQKVIKSSGTKCWMSLKVFRVNQQVSCSNALPLVYFSPCGPDRQTQIRALAFSPFGKYPIG